jgi:predicted CXXCH cytochrome family protein
MRTFVKLRAGAMPTLVVGMFLPVVLAAAMAAAAAAAEPKPPAGQPLPGPNNCILCHGNKDVWEGEQLKLFVTEADLAGDIHWQSGMRCQDCHGGNPRTEELRQAHAAEDGFRKVASPKDVPEFCGKCHADIEYMRRYRPSPRTDQLAEYWTSDHGHQLKTAGDLKVATCISCHDRPHGSGAERHTHGIRPVIDSASLVYRTRVAKTCATCHSDRKLMAGRQYHAQPLPCDQYDQWTQSVHGKAMLEKGDLSAPTCNNCHGNHGAVPPQVDSVANACGACHGKVAKLFADTRMRHKFESVGLPGCATCHGSHEIHQPGDAMLGMQSGAVCARCHEQGKFGATLAGAETARKLSSDLEQLKDGIEQAQDTLTEAERLGMEVSQPQFNLRKASDALTNARSLIHAFQPDPVEKALAGGQEVVAEVQQQADHALAEHTSRRIWLAASLAPILLVILLLLLYIRSLPAAGSGAS